MIYDFIDKSGGVYLQSISRWFPPAILGLVIACAALFPLGMVCFNRGRKHDESLLMAALSMSVLGAFIYLTGYSDEVFINLEHPWNLFHHAKFSFSPHRLEDGTVEFLYYVLLTPFAFSRAGLVYANLGAGFIIAWLHLYLLWGKTADFKGISRWILPAAFTLYAPVSGVLAGGFGNGLLSLGFLYAVICQTENRDKKSLLIASLLPLLRPEAGIYTASIALIHVLRKKRVPLWFFLASAVSMTAYFLFVKLYYGHWMPTPLIFKFSRLLLLMQAPELTERLFRNIGFLAAAVLMISFGGIFLLKRMRSAEKNWAATFLCFLPLALIVFFYGWFNPGYSHEYRRYTLGFEILAACLFLHGLSLNSKQARLEMIKPHVIFLVIASLYVSAHACSYVKANKPEIMAHKMRTDYLGKAGMLADVLTPDAWRFATTELNASGYMTDRKIIDLWGYSNREIAVSRTLSEGRIPNSPDFFSETKPEIAFLWWVGYFNSASRPFEESVVEGNMSKKLNQFGDAVKVAENYDFFMLRHGRDIFTYAVHKELSPIFQEKLNERGFVNNLSREVDMDKLRENYSRQILVAYKIR